MGDVHVVLDLLLDLLLDRKPFADDAAALAARVQEGELIGAVTATTVTTVDYLAAKALDGTTARIHVGRLLRLFEVAPVTRGVLEAALELPFAGFEDAVLHESAREWGATAIVTRNQRQVRGASLTVYGPDELLAALESPEETDEEGPVSFR